MRCDVNKWLFPAVTALAVLQGCASVPRGNIPVVDSSTRVSNSERVTANRSAGGYNAGTAQAQTLPEDSGVTVMIPQGAGASGIQTFPAANGAAPISTSPITPGPITPGPITTGPVTSAPMTTNPNPIADEPFDIAAMNSAPQSTSAPTGIPRSGAATGGLSADEQLDGPVLALLTTAKTSRAAVTSTVPHRAWSVLSALPRASHRYCTVWPRYACRKVMHRRPSSWRVVL